jgi:para-nitrobenzyl esterase
MRTAKTKLKFFLSAKFEQALPLPADAKPGTEPRASHASEIEYVFTVLYSKKLPWTKEDYKVSDVMFSYRTTRL